MSVLREQKKHHVGEEEKDLFPKKARKLLGAERLEELGSDMERLADELVAAGDPRMQVPNETEEAAHI